MTHCGRSGMSDYIRMVHIKNEHSCHGHYSHGCSNIWSHCCGGGTSFMGGVGAGLAYSLVNWAMSGLTNWIGGMGFGGGNWFGGMGWGNVGLGGGNWGFWGLNGANGRDGADGSRSTKGDYYSRRYGSSDRTSGSEGADGADGKKTDKDALPLDKFLKDATALIEQANDVDIHNETDVNKYNKKLADAKETVEQYVLKDDYLTESNNILKEQIKKKLDDAKLTCKPKSVEVTEGQIEIAGKAVDIESIGLPEVKNLTPAEISKITPEKAIEILAKIGIYDKNTKVAKMSLEYNVLLLLQKAEVDVKCATNPDSDDKYIKGKISNVLKDDNGKLSYDIDCKGVSGATYGYKYSFKQQDDNNQFRLTEIYHNNSDKEGWIHPKWNSRDYIFSDDTLTINGDPQVSANEGNGRKKLLAGQKATGIFAA